MKIEELKQQESLWVANPGIIHPEYPHQWLGFFLPKEMKITECEEVDIYVPLHNIQDHYVLLQLEGWRGVHKCPINIDGIVEFKFTPFIGLTEIEVIEPFIKETKRILRTSWNSTNGVRHRDILKQYIIENHLEYFSIDYPEMII